MGKKEATKRKAGGCVRQLFLGGVLLLLLGVVAVAFLQQGKGLFGAAGGLADRLPDFHSETQIIVAAMREVSSESNGYWRATSVNSQGVMSITDVNSVFGVAVGVAEGICTFPFRADYGLAMARFPEPRCAESGCSVTIPPVELMAVEPDTAGWKCTWDTSWVPTPLSKREHRAVTAITEVARSQASAGDVIRRVTPQVEQEYRKALEARARRGGLRLALLSGGR